MVRFALVASLALSGIAFVYADAGHHHDDTASEPANGDANLDAVFNAFLTMIPSLGAGGFQDFLKNMQNNPAFQGLQSNADGKSSSMFPGRNLHRHLGSDGA